MIIFIPIKENSQRVPRKNFRIFHNEPLYKHQLLKFKDFTIFVDTDSNEIIDNIKNDKRLDHVTVYKRQNNLIGDNTPVNLLIKNFIEQFSINDIICQIHVTSPFLQSKTINNALDLLENYDSIMSVNKIQSRLWRKEKYGICPINHNPMKLEQTQDLPVYYEENSGFYMFYSDVFLSSDNRVGKNPYLYELKTPENLDIDTEEDWRIVNEYNRIC